jgi:hypothetical protein
MRRTPAERWLVASVSKNGALAGFWELQFSYRLADNLSG